MSCEFCAIANERAPAEVIASWPDALAIRPLGPCTPGHMLVIPRAHVPDAGTDPTVTAATYSRAAELLAALPDGNLITSKGQYGTQSVYHLHIHVLPRAACDGLALPWHDGNHTPPPHKRQ